MLNFLFKTDTRSFKSIYVAFSIFLFVTEANANAIIPMVKELLEKAICSMDVTLPVASRLIGRLCHSLLGNYILTFNNFISFF